MILPLWPTKKEPWWTSRWRVSDRDFFSLNCWGFQVGGKHPKLSIFISLCIALYGLFTYYIILYTSRFILWNRVNFQAPSSDHPTQRKVTRAVNLNQQEPLAVSTGHKMLHSTLPRGNFARKPSNRRASLFPWNDCYYGKNHQQKPDFFDQAAVGKKISSHFFEGKP